jgi:hypothetical protein
MPPLLPVCLVLLSASSRVGFPVDARPAGPASFCCAPPLRAAAQLRQLGCQSQNEEKASASTCTQTINLHTDVINFHTDVTPRTMQVPLNELTIWKKLSVFLITFGSF